MGFGGIEGSISSGETSAPKGARPSAAGFRISDRFALPWDERKTISAAHAAEMLDCGRMTVLRLIQRRDILAYQLRPGVAGSPFRISYDSVLKYLAKIHDKAGVEPRFSV